MTSRNLEYRRVINELKELIIDKSLVLDRRYSYFELFSAILEKGIKFVVKLNTGNKLKILDANGERISLTINLPLE